jgi:hypothetical protein
MEDTPLLVDVFPVGRSLLISSSDGILGRSVHIGGGKGFVLPHNKVARSALGAHLSFGCFCVNRDCS